MEMKYGPEIVDRTIIRETKVRCKGDVKEEVFLQSLPKTLYLV